MSIRIALIISIIISALIHTQTAFAADSVSVFDVRKTLPLEPSEPVYHDYYLNAGPEAGLKKGMYVSVVRKTPIHDPVGNKQQGTLSVEVARLQIIHVERGISVGRTAANFGSIDRPVVDFEGIMIGDVLDLTTISMEAPRKRAAIRPEQTTPAAAPLQEAGKTESSSVDPGTVSIPVPAPQPKAEKGAETEAIEKAEIPTESITAENSFPEWIEPVMVHAVNEQSNI